MRLPVCPDIRPGRFPSSFPVHAGIVTLNRVSESRRWMDYRSAARVRLNSDEPCCALVSVKHHLITGCVFIIIVVVIIIIIISLHPSLKSETMGSPKRLLLNWSSLALQPQPGPIPPQQPAVWLGNYPGIDSPNRDHFFTSRRITKRLIISPAHLHSFLANVSASQSLY